MVEKSPQPVPSIQDIRDATRKKFGRDPCLWQMKIAQAILKGDQDVILTSATGSGKMLTFWIPLLFWEKGIQIVCAPLNVLGSINTQALAEYGIPAINVTAENATAATFKVRVRSSYHTRIDLNTDQVIEDLRYRVVFTNIETLMKDSLWGFSNLWKKHEFTRRLISLIFDEAHCISKWARFRQDYRQVERL